MLHNSYTIPIKKKKKRERKKKHTHKTILTKCLWTERTEPHTLLTKDYTPVIKSIYNKTVKKLKEPEQLGLKILQVCRLFSSLKHEPVEFILLMVLGEFQRPGEAVNLLLSSIVQ